MRQGKKEEPNKSLLYNRIKPKKHFSGKTPNILIGSYGYPRVNVGALTAENFSNQDDAKAFIKNNTKIEEILAKRQALVNSRMQLGVKDLQEKFAEQTQEIAKSKQAVQTEVELEKPLFSNTSFHEKAMPHGPSAQLKKLDITDNPSIPKAIERLSEDTDVKASIAIQELQKKNFDEYYLTKLLSAGTLGEKRKLVPTKWSITAIDDTFAKNLHEKILDNPEHDYALLKGDYLGNYFIILVLPGPWSFELIEIVMPNTIYNSTNEIMLSTDLEYTQGRKKYAEQTAGGYYATRLPFLEYFIKTKRQGRVIALRVITKEYTVPLGVWVVREAARKAIEQASKEQPDTRKTLLKETIQELKKHKIKKPEGIIVTSKLLKERQSGLKTWL